MQSIPVDHVSTVVDSPVGKLTLVARPFGLAAILWENDRPGRVRLNITSENSKQPILAQTRQELEEYFAGDRSVFDVPLDFVGTDFQKQVWQALRTIPFGETRSYGQIARQIGAPKAVRAVGAANGRNPVSIIMPCHRVIGSTGDLTGFAGGLDRKLYLLELEKIPHHRRPTLFDQPSYLAP
ncbi:MAG: methylated-DNA--[protein]-cysteine S-methyltransferase [Rhizobiaceae bacterium]|nr:methylated-DNA--[protein]-cysteine S-methyltransferase [Rhizobiaceae bacterium]